MLARRLSRQMKKASQYFIGHALTAPDIYWTCFSNMIHLMPPEWCFAPEGYEMSPCAKVRAHLTKPIPQILMDHRDRIAKTYFKLPIDF